MTESGEDFEDLRRRCYLSPGQMFALNVTCRAQEKDAVQLTLEQIDVDFDRNVAVIYNPEAGSVGGEEQTEDDFPALSAASTVMKHSKAPVIFSHSSSHFICKHHRNMPDQLLHELVRKTKLTE